MRIVVEENKQEYQLLVFDWDGTLMDSSRKIVNCFEGAAMTVGLALPDPDQVRSYIGLGLDESFRRLYPDIDSQMINPLIAHYREYWLYLDRTPMSLFAGVKPGLRVLQKAGYLLTIATGKSRRGLDRVLVETSLKQDFFYSRCADETRSKPHPQMLLDVLDYTGMENHQGIMIGDTTFDLEMARNAGMDGLGVGYGSHSKQHLKELSMNQEVFDDFTQLVDYFA
jgi:phosphoglycolate phosphatase